MTHLTDEVLHSLCDNGDYSRSVGTIQEIRDHFQDAFREGQLSRVVRRINLADRFPIFGKQDDLFTKDLIGYNWNAEGRSNGSRKRVTVPTFDIQSVPVVPAEWFNKHRVYELRRVIDEAVAAMLECEIGYFAALIQSASGYSKYYPLMNLEGSLTEDYFRKATASMVLMGIEPCAIFMNQQDAIDENYTVARNLGIELIVSPSEDRDYYIFGRSKNPELATAHIVDNSTEFRIKYMTEPRKEPTKLQFGHNGGYLVSKPSTLKLHRILDLAEEGKKPKPRIFAYVVGEEGADVESVVG